MTASTPVATGQAGGQVGVAPPAFRLPPETRVGAVQLQVSDLERSLAWYRDVLGFRLLERANRDLVLGALDDDRPLVRLHERVGAASVPHHGRLGLYHFAILLPDRQALGRLVAHLAKLGERVGAADHLVSEAIYLHDPDGLGIEVYADRPRSGWQAENGELRMATLPLDLAGLMRDAGGEAWIGMPVRTVMGHVHLHVGDLARASSFYHAALGLDRMVWSYSGALFLAAGGYHHHLGLNTWAGPAAVPALVDEARLIAWQLELPEFAHVAAARSSLQAAGFAVMETAHGVTASDPWGTTLQLVVSTRDW